MRPRELALVVVEIPSGGRGELVRQRSAHQDFRADPDIAAWQRQTMAQSMQQMQADIPELMAQISALQNGEATAPAANRSVTNSNLEAMRGGGNQTPPAEPDTEE